HDPYWDIPLNENLPEPVIDLPLPDDQEEGGADGVDAHLWEERDGQLSLEPPGEIFDAGARRSAAPAAVEGRRAGRRSRSRRPAAPAAPEGYDELAAHLRNQGRITSADAQDLLGLSAAEVRPILKSLVDNGLAEKAGRGRGTTYLLK
ncbi:MAG: hypothetical protein D6773_10585, partial [Alphaproteobacteria bacterium]